MALKSSLRSIAKGIQRALQLDLFSDFLVPDIIPSKPPVYPRGLAPPDIVVNPALPKQPKVTNKRRILIQEQLLEYELRRSARRSIGFLINEQGLRITAPRWVTIADIENAIRDKQSWIIDKLSAREQRASQTPARPPRFEDGMLLPYLGGTIRLRIIASPTARAAAQFDPEQNTLLMQLRVTEIAQADEAHIKERIKAWLQSEARRVFAQRLPLYAEKLGVDYASLALSSATTRWGSCTAQGKIRLNWRLIHLPMELIDYVVAHELAHRLEMNHSPRFWAAVGSVFPDYAQARRTLRQSSTQIIPNL